MPNEVIIHLLFYVIIILPTTYLSFVIGRIIAKNAIGYNCDNRLLNEDREWKYYNYALLTLVAAFCCQLVFLILLFFVMLGITKLVVL
jgi:hypothetical protein